MLVFQTRTSEFLPTFISSSNLNFTRLSTLSTDHSGITKFSRQASRSYPGSYPHLTIYAPLGHFADHTVEDIIEKIACQFTAKHIRGRPRPPYWYPGWPLYVCDSRYNDKEKSFVKIKNWNSCIPEEYRKNDFMPIYPFERIVYPKRYPSPFLSGITGPGRIGDNIQKPPEPEKLPEDVSGGRRRSKRHLAQSTDHVGPRHGTFVGTPVPAPHMNQQMAPGGSALPATIPAQIPGGMGQNQDKSIGAAIGGLANFHGNAVVETLPAETSKVFPYHRDHIIHSISFFIYSKTLRS